MTNKSPRLILSADPIHSVRAIAVCQLPSESCFHSVEAKVAESWSLTEMPTIIHTGRRVRVELGGQVRGGYVERAIHIAGRDGAAVHLRIASRHHHCDLHSQGVQVNA